MQYVSYTSLSQLLHLFDNHSKLIIQHIWGGDLYGHLTSMRILTLISDKNIHMSSENFQESGYSLSRLGFAHHLVLLLPAFHTL